MAGDIDPTIMVLPYLLEGAGYLHNSEVGHISSKVS
jgi:hypothetical protein